MKVKIFCSVLISSEDTKILRFNQYQKSYKTPFFIYADLESLIEKMNECKNIPEKSSTAKVGEDISSGFSMPTISSFKDIENKHYIHRGKDFLSNIHNSQDSRGRRRLFR